MAVSYESTALLPEGYPIEIFSEVNAKYLCGICNVTLKNPVQSFCGHRFCKECFEHKMKSSPGEEVNCHQCELEDTVTEYSRLKLDQIFPDNAIRREMMNSAVRCSYGDCTWSGTFKDFESHHLLCEWQPMMCVVCKKNFARKEFDGHRCSSGGEVSSGETSCPFGCGLKVESEVVDHLSSSVLEHLELLRRKVDHLDKVIGQHQPPLASPEPSLSSRIQALEVTITRLSSQIPGASASSKGPEDTAICGAEHGLTMGVAEAVGAVAEKMNIYEGVITVLNREVEKLSMQMEASERQRRLDRDQLDTLDRKVKSLERMLALKDATISDLDLRITSLEETSYDGTLLWRIGDFQRRRQEAISGRMTSIYSPVFYTSRTGYKMCARIYLNGDGMGKGTHVSLFFVIMRGQYDALLKWPFRQKVTLMFLDQSNREHVVDAFRPDPTSSSFKRPTTEMNIASGCPLLMSLTQLDSATHSYVKDNAAFVKIIVSTDDL